MKSKLVLKSFLSWDRGEGKTREGCAYHTLNLTCWEHVPPNISSSEAWAQRFWTLLSTPVFNPHSSSRSLRWLEDLYHYLVLFMCVCLIVFFILCRLKMRWLQIRSFILELGAVTNITLVTKWHYNCFKKPQKQQAYFTSVDSKWLVRSNFLSTVANSFYTHRKLFQENKISPHIRAQDIFQGRLSAVVLGIKNLYFGFSRLKPISFGPHLSPILGWRFWGA